MPCIAFEDVQEEKVCISRVKYVLCRPDESHEELRCVLAVIRHGDRTPKQKMKMKVTQVTLMHITQQLPARLLVCPECSRFDAAYMLFLSLSHL